MASTVTAPRSDSVSDARRGGAPRRRGINRVGAAPWLFLAPYLVLFVTFVLVPIVYGFWISLHRYDYTLPNRPFVGFENYGDLFTPGSVTFEPFWNAMRATGIFTLFSVPLLLGVPLVIALVMNKKFPGRNLFRAVYFAPYVLGVAVVTVLWRYLLSNVGPVNYYLGLLGLPDDIAWTTSTPPAWVALVGVTVWWTLGFNAVIYLAGLQDIPRELYEAAEMDGASRWQQFRHVTLPGLRPVLSFVTMVTIIASANMFGQSYLITRGAPGTETRTAIYQIAETGLRNYQMGAASAMSYVLTLFLVLLSIAVFWLFRERQKPKGAAPLALRQGRG
ncbi:carbohydrate ABC transporter permease [Geodermatophilus sp. SYSU D00691]